MMYDNKTILIKNGDWRANAILTSKRIIDENSTNVILIEVPTLNTIKTPGLTT